MSSDQKLSKSQSNEEVSDLVIDAIKSLKKTGGSSSEAILQYIRSHKSSNIDAIEIERCLNIALAKKIVRSRTNKKSGIKFYKISAKVPLSTEKMEMEAKVQENNKSGKKLRKRKLRAKKNVNSAKKFEENAECSKTAENKEPASQKNYLICDICKVTLSSEKNLKVHEEGRKHQNALNKKKGKEQKKNMNSSTEKRDINDDHSSSVPTDFQCSNPSETNFNVSNGKKSHSHDYKDSYSNSSNNYYSPNHKKPYPPNYREPYSTKRRESYNNRRNCDYRNYHWNRWPPNQPFRNGPDKRFQSYNHYNRYDQNYHCNQSPHMEKEHSSIHSNNWAGIPNPESNEFFSENIQSENIQPVEGETHSTNNNFDEIINTSTDDHKSPVKKSDKKAKRSPRIPIKVITKTAVVIEDIQNQLESEKHQEKGVVLSENIAGKRLAHWINPSNQKDQAEIRRLVTEFSKSKKKENLIKLKLHTDKVPVNSDSNQSVTEEPNNVSSLPITPELPESMNSSQLSFETVTDVSSNSLTFISTENKKRRHSSSLTDIASNTTLPNIPLPAARTRSESLTLNENTKILQGIGAKRKANKPCESPFSRKRKDSVDQGSNSKKHRCSSAECLEKCIESAIANTDTLINSERLESIESTPLTMNEASKECSSQKEAVYIKKEIVDEMDTTQMTSLSLNELIQKQTDVIANCQDDASMTPVESLINLFATGNITIKKEFDDPLIDAIRSIDPVLLNKVCEDQLISDKNDPNQEIIEKVIEPVVSPSPTIPDNSLTLSLKNILNELQIISDEEENVKSNLLNADQQIQYYQSLLDEWKTKKIKFQSEEEILRNKRNTLVRTMNDLVMQQSAECRSTVESPEERPSSNSPQNRNVINNTLGSINNEIDAIKINDTEKDSSTSIQQETTTENSMKIDDDVIPLESDEVVILPLPENRIPVIDIDLIASPEKNNDTDDFSITDPSTDCISANCLKIRDLVAHNAHINSIQVFGDYLYTCASDKTAKRFHLKDPTQIITYKHAEKNIYHLFIEKMQGKTYVFTCGLNSNFITVFDAESALKVKVHQFRPTIASMCKGRYKIYVGFRNGVIATCNWKDYKELVNIEEPIRSIATTHQGGVNILVALSTKGHVSIRDADRNGLLIKYIKALTHVPLFMSIYNDWVYLSSAGYLSVLDLSSGTFVKKYELPAAYTSLTVYKDHIFTTSFSGFVRCYSKNDIQDVKAYYGAGKMALTCIYAHDGWIFTGNRTGEISVFKFDPETSLPCQFGTCQMVFARIDDLMYHVLQGKDHNLISMKTCLWQKCKATIKKSWDQEAIHGHIRAHITASYPYLHEPKYNLTV
ncbi:Zinc finger protein 106 like protein [Argiope bruennichi]|uniref:Zinc finger protein 106 like protein n=1 Tax=Argiope bruennichi TaxID=94029 RepID=A0A8T0EHB1_ARGBR|nr:Zinc finger protein 106 like protein [Argiope bruennichi]